MGRKAAVVKPPTVITYEKGQDHQDRVLPIGDSNITTVSTQNNIGHLQVLEPATDAEKAAALAAQDRLLTIEELINIEDDPEPLVAVVDPDGARTTQTADAVAKASNDRPATIQAVPKGPSPTIKPLCLTGEPSLTLSRSTSYVLLPL